MVTTIIVNFFGADLTVGAVTSVLTDAPACKIVVVDNSECPVETERLKASLHGRAELLTNRKNLGFGAACNIGLSAADADYAVLLNPEARALPSCIPTHTSVLVEDAELGVIRTVQ